MAHTVMHGIDRHPLVATVFVLLGVLSTLGAVVAMVYGLLRLIGVA